MKYKKLNHSVKMLCINIKSYTLFSISMILSLSILLTIMIFTDSKTFNKFKDLEKVPIGSVSISKIDPNNKAQNLLREKVMSDTEYAYYIKSNVYLNHFSTNSVKVNATFNFIEEKYFSLFYYDGLHFIKNECIIGVCKIEKNNEIIIDNLLYSILENKDQEVKKLSLPIINEKGEKEFKDFYVKGVIEVNGANNNFTSTSSGGKIYYVNIYFNYANETIINDGTVEKGFLVNSNKPEELTNYARSLGYIAVPAKELHEKAMQEKQNQVIIKELLLIILFFILGINVYGNFMNALKDRHIEIGVKRAIGAKKIDIIYQFFTEIFIVLLCNIIISILISTTMLLIYKLFVLYVYGEQFILYFSAYSVLSFLIFSVFITLLCSFIFAFKAANLSIIDIIKESS